MEERRVLNVAQRSLRAALIAVNLRAAPVDATAPPGVARLEPRGHRGDADIERRHSHRHSLFSAFGDRQTSVCAGETRS